MLESERDGLTLWSRGEQERTEARECDKKTSSIREQVGEQSGDVREAECFSPVMFSCQGGELALTRALVKPERAEWGWLWVSAKHQRKEGCMEQWERLTWRWAY